MATWQCYACGVHERPRRGLVDWHVEVVHDDKYKYRPQLRFQLFDRKSKPEYPQIRENYQGSRNMFGYYDPRIPTKSSRFMIRVRGIFHRVVLDRVAAWYMRYCMYRGIKFPTSDQVDLAYLPFNTMIKYSERIREEEALSMALAHSLGLPAPRLISYGDEFDGNGGSIWMTRLPGEPLNQVWRSLSEAEKATIMSELDQCLIRLRQCRNPNSPRIFSISGTSIKSFRTCGGVIPPCRDEDQFLDYLLSARDPNLFSPEVFASDTEKIKRIARLSHSIVFAHGDLFRHNILVKNGHLSGILDWECAGWLPEYWDYTTMTFRGYPHKSDWQSAIYANPGFKYWEELEADSILALATQLSFPR